MSPVKTNHQINTSLGLILACLILLTPSFILLFAASWLGDEYFQAHLITTAGWEAFRQRLVGWSPRPFSDGILSVYYLTVAAFKNPLVELFLFLIWLTLLMGMFFSLRETTKKYSQLLESLPQPESTNLYINLIFPLLITLILFVYFISIEKPSEIFFWPAGAAPYIFSLLGIFIIFNQSINLAESERITYGNVFILIIFAFIVAFSSESGAIYQFIYSSILLFILVLSRSKKYFPFLPFSQLNWSNFSKLGFSLITALAASSLVLFMIKNSRVGKPEMNSLQSPITGKLTDSFVLALGRFLQELFSLDDPQSDEISLLSKIALFFLLFMLFSQAKIILPQSAKIVCLGVITSLLLTNLFMLIAVYYQFGEVCCERHLHFRSIFLGLAIFLAALALARDKLLPIGQKQYSLTGIFTLTMVLLVSLQFERMKADLLNFNHLVSINNSNWQNNINSSSPVGKYQNYKNNYASYVLFYRLEPGIYNCPDNTPDHNKLYMTYFQKSKLYVEPPELKTEDKAINFTCEPNTVTGYIDAVNGLNISTLQLDRKQNIEIVGWAANQDLSRPATQVIITLDNSPKVVAKAEVGIERPDVANSFNNPKLLESGWRAVVSVDDLVSSPVTLKAWSYEPKSKVATPLNQTFQITFP
jgi:hypothetical protein